MQVTTLGSLKYTAALLQVKYKHFEQVTITVVAYSVQDKPPSSVMVAAQALAAAGGAAHPSSMQHLESSVWLVETDHGHVSVCVNSPGGWRAPTTAAGASTLPVTRGAIPDITPWHSGLIDCGGCHAAHTCAR